MSDFEQKLLQLGIILPEATSPVANYVSFMSYQQQITISGQLPVEEGKIKFIGKVGSQISIEQAKEASALCTINLLSQLKKACQGNLNLVAKCLKLTIFVNADADFTQHSVVANGASDLICQIFGENGKHARVAVGAGSLPFGASVEVEGLFLLA
jgi:enamine deaminase RidA (YjgF/YER057c/UK114 family)